MPVLRAVEGGIRVLKKQRRSRGFSVKGGLELMEVFMASARCTQRPRNLQQEWLKLEKLGVPLEPLEYRAMCIDSSGLLIEQNSIDGNMLLELNNGATACVLDVDIASYGGGKIIINERILELPWSLTPVEWLPDVDAKGNKVKMYEFPGERQLAYPRDEVINDRFDKRGVLKRGDQIKGLLLGVCWEPIPVKYPHGCDVMAPLRIFDQLHRGYSEEFTLRVWRSASRTQRKSLKEARRRLFSDCDSRTGVRS
jgi:hypothetical protein